MKNNYTVYKNLFWKMMKVSMTQLTALLICFVSYAHTNVAQQLLDKKITLHLEGVSLKKALHSIENAGQIKFVYSSTQLSIDQQVSAHANDLQLGKLLDELFTPIDVDYQIQDDSNYIILTPAKKNKPSLLSHGIFKALPNLTPQNQKITGKVKDVNNNPLPGVNVTVKGTTAGTVTDIDGNYYLDVESDDILVFSFIGFITIEIEVLDRTVVDIILQEDISTLDEMVIVSTGYQELPKERATGSFSSADAEKLEAQVGVIDIREKFQGLLPGVLIDENNNISIRGQSSINASTDPVIVVDGFPTQLSLSSINPNDVETITVLQDAAAASIWGARASNGVIVITTKKGRKGEKATISYSTNMRITDVPDIGDLRLANSEQYIDAELETLDLGWVNLSNNGYSRVFDVYKQEHDGEITETEANALYDQLRRNNSYGEQDLFFEKGIEMQHNLSISGSTPQNDYYISLNYQDNKEYQIGNQDQRIKLMLKNSYQFHPKLRFDVQTTLSYIDSENNGVNMYQFARQKPYEMFLNDNGDYIPRYGSRTIEQIQDLKELGFYDWSYNLKQEQENNDRTTTTFSPRIIAGLHWEIIDGLTFDTKLQWETNTSKTETFYNEDTYFTRNLVNGFTAIGSGDELTNHIPRGTIFTYANSNMVARTWRNQLQFSKNYVDGKHRVDAIAGNEIYRVTTDYNEERYHNYDRQLLTYNLIDEQMLARGVSAYGGNLQYAPIYRPVRETENRYISYYFNGAYTFLDRYTFSASGRLDQSNLFGADINDRIAPLYSVGLAWHVTNEEFFNVAGIDFLKLRVTTGENGNVARNAGKVLVGEAANNSYSTSEPYLKIVTPENKGLKWETTRTFNMGMDFAVLNNRLDISLEYYKRSSFDVLGNAEADPSLGFATVYKNTSSIMNKGIDLRVNGRVLTGSLNWDVAFNLSTNNNEVTDFYVANPTVDNYLTGGYTRQVVGKPIDHLHALRWAGLDDDGHPQVYDSEGNAQSSEDPEAEPMLDWVAYQGTTTPRHYGAFINTFKYKGFRLNIITTYKAGHVMKLPELYLRGSDMILAEIDQRWREPGDEEHTDIPRMYDVSQDPFIRRQFYQNGDHRVVNASFIRLSNISLTYDFPTALFKKVIRSLQLQAQVSNIGIWTANDEGIDPEAIDRRYGTLSLTNPTVYTFGLKIDL